MDFAIARAMRHDNREWRSGDFRSFREPALVVRIQILLLWKLSPRAPARGNDRVPEFPVGAPALASWAVGSRGSRERCRDQRIPRAGARGLMVSKQQTLDAHH